MSEEQALTDWTDPKLQVPKMYELVILRTSEGEELSGWWTGHTWDGRRVTSETEVVSWCKKGNYGEWIRTQASWD